MNERAEHRDHWNDDLAAYALDALDVREAALVESHLAECSTCSERLRWLAPAVDVLPAGVVQRQPAPELRARLMAVVEAEAPPQATTAPVPRSTWLERIGLGGGSMRRALAGLAVILLVVTGVTGYALIGGDSTQTYAAAPTSSDSIASGTLEVNGDEGSLHVTHLPATRRDEVYQAWIQDAPGDGGAIVPSSVFVVDDRGTGEVAIPHGLDGAAQVMITREPEGGSEKPHESPLLIAQM